MKSPRTWRIAVLGCLLAVAGCTRVVDAPAPRPAPPVAPIVEGQVADLLSPDIQDKDGNLFVTVDPQECTGVAKEVDPPFIFDHDPAATDGGHWVADGNPEVYIEEMVGVFAADFDPRSALAEANRTIESCRGEPFTVVSMRGREYVFELLPAVDSGSPNILLWSFRADDWACDSAYVAAHNAAVEISTCGYVNGYDVATLARDALERIEKLANLTA
ncbi:sensor domain-containing protein [Mycolicibacterium sp. XJ1819]